MFPVNACPDRLRDVRTPQRVSLPFAVSGHAPRSPIGLWLCRWLPSGRLAGRGPPARGRVMAVSWVIPSACAPWRAPRQLVPTGSSHALAAVGTWVLSCRSWGPTAGGAPKSPPPQGPQRTSFPALAGRSLCCWRCGSPWLGASGEEGARRRMGEKAFPQPGGHQWHLLDSAVGEPHAVTSGLCRGPRAVTSLVVSPSPSAWARSRVHAA